MSPVEPLHADALRAALGERLIGREIIVLDETTSTNDELKRMAADHEEGLVVIGERQSAGRGQYGRRWESIAGKGLWMSMLLRPGISVQNSSLITDFLAQAISATIVDEIKVEPRIKPPNDIFIADRKVAGVLVEMRVEAGGGYHAIAGLGLNVNHALEDFPPALQDSAGSLAMAAGYSINRAAIAVALLRKLNQLYLALLA